MPSIFEYVSKKMVKNIGGKDLRPVKCLLDATKFRQLNVLRKNSQSRFWEQPDDNPVGFSLMDILEPSSSAPGHLATALIGGDISAGVEGSVSGNFIQAVSIPDPKLETLQNRKLLHPEPSFLTECRMRGDNLYVVTEAIELTKDTVLQEGSRVETLGKLAANFSLKARETKLSVPQGTVLAYRKKQLVIRKQGSGEQEGAGKWGGGLQAVTFAVPCPRRGRAALLTVPGSPPSMASLKSRWLSCGRSLLGGKNLGRSTGRIEEPLHQDFQLLQEEVSCNTALLAQLSKDVQAVIFHSILSLLGDREALCGLTNMLELDRLGQMEGPGGIILDELCQGTRPPWIDLKSLILYLLQALMVLSDTHLDMLALSMEKGILLHQRELVRSILQPNFKYPWCIPLTLQPQLLAPLQAEGLAITYGLLEECGLKMELNNYKPSWDLEAKMPMSALYGALSLLQQLTLPGGQ
uniref:Gasdermin-C n=1 Tax=Jaculus jaculus TaxID=51337 RepID=A0A8C5LIP4_JACJA